MSVSSLIDGLKVYGPIRSPCAYLPDREEQKVVSVLPAEGGAEIVSELTRRGFRRSHNIIYRPVCAFCSECTSVRVLIAQFSPSDSQRRVMRRNRTLTMSIHPAMATEEQYALFSAYQNDRHQGGDMARMTKVDYAEMIEHGTSATHLRLWRDERDALKAVLLADKTSDGLSAVYSFFDPQPTRQSLGTYIVLSTIDDMRQKGEDHLYLGYYVRGSQKMEYKARFQPLQFFSRAGWQPGPG